jgi:hypothetical protein
MGRSLRLRTRRSHTSTRNTENMTSLSWFGPPESNTLRPVVGVDCLRIAYMYKGSPRPPYIGQQMRSVPRLLVGYNQETQVYATHLAISRRSALVEIHHGLVLYAKSWGRNGWGRKGNLLEGLQEIVWAAVTPDFRRETRCISYVCQDLVPHTW